MNIDKTIYDGDAEDKTKAPVTFFARSGGFKTMVTFSPERVTFAPKSSTLSP